ncbi:hypothetical protein [Microbacterium capsulatum]|uniref:Uncharacterized protein n=1 Tax=Microbacterium capsulatum TaxID=3041921 RepID=A0ABU0XF95_9MICO|nr:hypothetical protein [Microbacterium sp. ASV81]MDQ4213775.1 hypothetical protein [Microbacterium sp. ASV81]
MSAKRREPWKKPSPGIPVHARELASRGSHTFSGPGISRLNGADADTRSDALVSAVVARWGVGGLINDLDELGKRETLPPEAFAAARALNRLLRALGITDGRSPWAARVWRAEP